MSADDKVVFGVNLSHDTACAAVIGGEVKVAIAEERLNRIKHCTGVTQFGKVIPYRSIRYCCDFLDIRPEQVDLFVVNSCRRNAIEQLRMQMIGIPEERIIDVPHPGHHLAHAYSAFYCSEFDEAAVIVVDANGTFFERNGSGNQLTLEKKEHFTCYYGDASGLRVVLSDHVMPGEVSIGELYCIYSAVLQLTPRHGPYGHDDPLSAGGKLMGLAAYDLERASNPDLWEFDGSRMAIRLKRVINRLEQLGVVGRRTPGDLDHIFGFQISNFVEFTRRRRTLKHPNYIALAGEAQRLLERALLEIAGRVHERSKSKNLCLAGGTMLNVTACTRLLEETPFERIFIQPAANDAGTAIGAALHGYRVALGGSRRPYLDRNYNTCLGRTYSPSEVERAIEDYRGSSGFEARRVASIQEKCDVLLPGLMNDSIVAVFDGRSEFGPRALGHRSLLASPSRAAMKDRMNKLKKREWYRPVAPVVLESEFNEFFSAPYNRSPFMSLSARCKPVTRERAPAVHHVDGTARPQTVNEERDPLLHRLLVEMQRRNAPPILINTSFNIEGEPIVETPGDALSTFLRAPLINSMLLGDWFIERIT